MALSGHFASKTPALFSQIAEVSSGRRLAWTDKGYLALIPAVSAPGDVIALLRGGRVPFVLRAGESGWRLVGPCYVYGIMEGEAFDEDLRGGH